MAIEDSVKVDYARSKAAFERAQARMRQAPDRAALAGPTAVVKVVENRLCEATVDGYTFLVDEPAERGGSGKAATAMGYFVAGAAACLTSQLTSFSSVMDLPFKNLQVQGRLVWDNRAKYGIVAPQRMAVGFVFRVSMASDQPVERLIEMFERAEGGCYASDAMREAIPLRAHLEVNGVEVHVQRRGEEFSDEVQDRNWYSRE